MTSRAKKTLILGIVVFVVACGVGFGIYYLFTTHSLTVSYKDAENVVVSTVDGNDIATINQSGDSIRVANNQSYVVNYKGKAGYQDGSVSVDNSAHSVNITPNYNFDKNMSLIRESQVTLQRLLVEKYPRANLYTMQSGEMYERGIWYATTLVMKNSTQYPDDNNTLRVIFQKKSGSWKLVTEAEILLLSNKYPQIPHQVLVDANNLPVPSTSAPRSADSNEEKQQTPQ